VSISGQENNEPPMQEKIPATWIARSNWTSAARASAC